MGWIIILFIWLTAPLAELGFVILLLVSNNKYKRRIQELEKGRECNTMQEKAKIWHDEVPKTDPQVWQKAESPQTDIQTDSLVQSEKKNCFPKKNLQAGLGNLSLILGVVFVILAGLIFATTTWHILSDIFKTFLVLACAALFFGASQGAEKVFHIRRTSNAFYILGSIFLFLSVLAAAYFKLLGPEFILDGQNRWKVLWAGSIIALGAFWAGLMRFKDRIYTQSCLWGMSLNIFFMARAFSVGWRGFLCVMTVYSAVLVVINAYGDRFPGQGKEKNEWKVLLEEGFQSFAPVHFGVFGSITGFWGMPAIWWMTGEAFAGVRNTFPDSFPILSFTFSGMVSMAALTAGICVLAWKEQRENCKILLSLAAAESVLYGAGWITGDFIRRMAVINLLFFLVLGFRYLKKEKFPESHSLFLDVSGAAAAVFTMIVFYSSGKGRADGLWLSTAAFGAYYVWFFLGKRQWPHLLACAGVLPLPFMAMEHFGLGFDQMAAGTTAVLVISSIGARCFCPVMEQDHRGQWRVDWFHILSVLIILWIYAMGNAQWRFVCIVLTGLYFLQYHTVRQLRKAAFCLSACCMAAAFWQQPFVMWPQVLSLELDLLPAVWLIWIFGRIWDKTSWLLKVQNAGYGVSLLLLCGDAVVSGQLTDALLLEGICLAVFIWAQIKKNVWWVRISAGIILAVALFMTRDFWLSISWWVYLLAAGIGLIIFAGILEKKRR